MQPSRHIRVLQNRLASLSPLDLITIGTIIRNPRLLMDSKGCMCPNSFFEPPLCGNRQELGTPPPKCMFGLCKRYMTHSILCVRCVYSLHACMPLVGNPWALMPYVTEPLRGGGQHYARVYIFFKANRGLLLKCGLN